MYLTQGLSSAGTHHATPPSGPSRPPEPSVPVAYVRASHHHPGRAYRGGRPTRLLGLLRTSALAAFAVGLTWAQSNLAIAAPHVPNDLDTVLPLVEQTYTYLHHNPELGKKEFKAHDFIEARLRELGYRVLFLPQLSRPPSSRSWIPADQDP